MRKFELNGISFEVPEQCLTTSLAEAIQAGRYEHNEADALLRNLVATDQVLDLGAGAGYLSILAAKVVGAENVTAVEPVPDMVPTLRKNLARNGADTATIIHGAVVPNDHVGGEIEFLPRQAFWASAIAPKTTEKNPRVTAVPAVKLADILDRVQPSFVIMDVEGTEADLCAEQWPEYVRRVVIEIHSKLYSASTIKSIFDGMSASGMVYMPWGTRGETIVFQRVEK